MNNKFVTWESLPKAIEAIRKNPAIKLVLTNGCFDILHPGHVYSLAFARSQGNMLLVLVNDDESVSKLKGPGKPVNTIADRIYLVGALEAVDVVVPLPSTNIVEALDVVKPDVWVKGGDYTLETLNQVERKLAESLGVQIVFCPTLQGFSTSSKIQQILSTANELMVNQILNPNPEEIPQEYKDQINMSFPRPNAPQIPQCSHLSTRTFKKPGCGCTKKVYTCSVKNRDLQNLGECNGCISKDSGSPTQQ